MQVKTAQTFKKLLEKQNLTLVRKKERKKILRKTKKEIERKGSEGER